MTLEDLANNVCVQGNYRVSAWKDDTEIILFQHEDMDGFFLTEKYADCKILYMFCPGDGYLHIEVEMED